MEVPPRQAGERAVSGVVKRLDPHDRAGQCGVMLFQVLLELALGLGRTAQKNLGASRQGARDRLEERRIERMMLGSMGVVRAVGMHDLNLEALITYPQKVRFPMIDPNGDVNGLHMFLF